MIALVAGAGLPSVSSADFQFEAAGTPTGWEAVLNYEIDANWTNVTDYWVDGDFSDVIVCNVDWVLVSEETTSTDRDNLRQYALDYDEGEFGFLQVKNGTQTKKIKVCTSFDLQGTSASADDWDCKSSYQDGPNGEDSESTGPQLLLGDQGGTGHSISVTDEEPGSKLTGCTADTTGPWYPFTGKAKFTLESNDGEPVNKITAEAVGGVVIDWYRPPPGESACGSPCYLVADQGELFLDGGVDEIPSTGHIKATVET